MLVRTMQVLAQFQVLLAGMGMARVALNEALEIEPALLPEIGALAEAMQQAAEAGERACTFLSLRLEVSKDNDEEDE